MPWFGAQTVFLHTDFDPPVYEERVNVLQAASQDDAITKGERIADAYADEDTHYLGYIVVFEMFDALEDGAEVFSLMRDSPLSPDDYISRFFDTGAERVSDFTGD